MSRRTLLASMGGAAALAASLSAVARPAFVGRVEDLFRQALTLRQTEREAELAWCAYRGDEAEKASLWEAWLSADAARQKAEDAAIDAAPETVTDALLVIALAA